MKCACICPGDDLHPCLHDLGEGLLWERGVCSGGGLFWGVLCSHMGRLHVLGKPMPFIQSYPSSPCLTQVFCPCKFKRPGEGLCQSQS